MINGFIVTKLKVNPFVATLGSGSVFGGVAYIHSRRAEHAEHSRLPEPRHGALVGRPISIWMMIVTFLVGGFVLRRPVYGRSIYAIGGNTEAARLSGMRVDLLRGSTYVITRCAPDSPE